jgi:biopolymer transport protein TolQ
MSEPSLWSFISHADVVVKLVMLVLLLASIISWSIIIQRSSLIRKTKQDLQSFESTFWSGKDLYELYDTTSDSQHGLASIFKNGFKEFNKLRVQNKIQPNAVLEGVQRAMRVAQTNTVDHLEKRISFLATVGSTGPYIGLLGTVWGIMSSFRALGTAQQASIAMVAPGISEALIATAIGLIAAIPAVIAYNRFSSSLESIQGKCESFQEEFTNILQRQLYNDRLSESIHD